MTLGNSPQPLTRRQLRELAQENASTADTGSAGETAAPVTAAPVTAEPDAAAPAPQAPEQHHSRHTSPPVERPEGARPAPAPLPIPDESPVGAPRAESPVVAVVDSVVVDPGHTLTRRELRALQAAASAGAGPVADADTTADGLAPRPAPATSTPSVSPRPPVTATPVTPGPVTPAPVAVAVGAAALKPSAAESAPGNTPEKSAAAAGSTNDAEATARSNGLHPPIGHWSVDRDDDSHIQSIGRRDDQTFDDLVGNGVGAGGIPTTTNALILPAIPRQGTAGPITSTGEIMITGSIDLPRSLGATGQHPNLFDSSEMDRMLDQLDEGGHHNDVAPVSASRAVSTHTSTRGVMTPPRKRGASLPTVLAITAAVLAIGVLSLFVVGYAFNIY